MRYLDPDHLACGAGNRLLVVRVESGGVVLSQELRAGLDHGLPNEPWSGPEGDVSADGRIVVAADSLGVHVFEVVR